LRPDLALQSARELLHQLQEPVGGWTAKMIHEKHLSSVVFQHCLCCHTGLVRCVHFLNVPDEGLADLEENLSPHFRCHVALRCPFDGLVVLAVGRVEQAASAVPQVRVYQSMLERCRRSPESYDVFVLFEGVAGATCCQTGDDDEYYTVPALLC